MSDTGHVESRSHARRLCAGRESFVWLPVNTAEPILVRVKTDAVRDLAAHVQAYPSLSLLYRTGERSVVFFVHDDRPQHDATESEASDG